MESFKDDFVCHLLANTGLPAELKLMIASHANKRDLLRLMALNTEFYELASSSIYHDISLSFDGGSTARHRYRMQQDLLLLRTLLTRPKASQKVKRLSITIHEVRYDPERVDLQVLFQKVDGHDALRPYIDLLDMDFIPGRYKSWLQMRFRPGYGPRCGEQYLLTYVIYAMIAACVRLQHFRLNFRGTGLSSERSKTEWFLLFAKLAKLTCDGHFAHLTTLDLCSPPWPSRAVESRFLTDLMMQKVPRLQSMDKNLLCAFRPESPEHYASLTKLVVDPSFCDMSGLQQLLSMTPQLRHLEYDIWVDCSDVAGPGSFQPFKEEDLLKGFFTAIYQVRESLETLIFREYFNFPFRVQCRPASSSYLGLPWPRAGMLSPMKKLSKLIAPCSVLFGHYPASNGRAPLWDWDEFLPKSLGSVSISERIDSFIETSSWTTDDMVDVIHDLMSWLVYRELTQDFSVADRGELERRILQAYKTPRKSLFSRMEILPRDF